MSFMSDYSTQQVNTRIKSGRPKLMKKILRYQSDK